MSGRLKFALHSLVLALFLTLLAVAQTSQTGSATNAESRKTASGVFSAFGQTPLAFSLCNPGQALGISGNARAIRTCAFSYGKEVDQLSRLSYYGYRYYDPLSLQWTQADPLYCVAPDIAYDQPRHMGLYTFSLNNPMRYLDPDGREALTATGAAIGAGAAVIAYAFIRMRGGGNDEALRGALQSGQEAVTRTVDTVSDGVEYLVSPIGGQLMAQGRQMLQERAAARSQGSQAETVDVGRDTPLTLPENPEDLANEGFTETTDSRSGGKGPRTFENPKTGEKLTFDKGKTDAHGHGGKDHYHRPNPKTTDKGNARLDGNGNPTPKGSGPSHIAPGTKI